MMSFDSYYDPPDDGFEDLCWLIGQHWFTDNPEFLDHDNDVIDRIAEEILANHDLAYAVRQHFARKEGKIKPTPNVSVYDEARDLMGLD